MELFRKIVIYIGNPTDSIIGCVDTITIKEIKLGKKNHF